MEHDESMTKQYGSNKVWKERIVRYAVGIPILLVIYLVLILFNIYPHWPIDIIGWSILIVAGIPISLCLEWIGSSIFSEKTTLKISRKRLSAKRIMFALFVVVVIEVVLFLLWLVFGSFSHIHQHFK